MVQIRLRVIEESRLFKVGILLAYGIGAFSSFFELAFVLNEEGGKINFTFIFNWEKPTA